METTTRRASPAVAAAIIRLRNVPLIAGNITLELPAGSLQSILCANSGECTQLAHFLTGLQRPATGSIRVAGHNLYGGHDDLDAVRRCCGVVSAEAGIGVLLNGREYLEMAATFYGDSAPSTGVRLERLVELLGMKHLLSAAVGSLTRIQRVKLSLIAAMICRPPVYVCDNPLLDSDAQADAQLVLDAILGLQLSGATVLVLTSNPSFHERFAALRHI